MTRSSPSSTDDPEFIPYDTSSLSFADSGAGPVAVWVISLVEWITGKVTLLRLANKFEKSGRKFETTFWEKVLELLKVTVDCDREALGRIPATGPVVMVANHPFGFVDGLAMTHMVSQVRQDLKILTRAFFASVPEIAENMVPVAFPHDVDSHKRNIAVRKEVMEHLADGGVVILFPAGRTATARRWFGPAIEHEWHPFTAKMILKSRARVVPVFFPGQNSWLFQLVQMFSTTLRQSLMIHEVVRRMGTTVRPVIGTAIERDVIDNWHGTQTEFMAFLRGETLALKDRSENRP